jgi:hypothetical protein
MGIFNFESELEVVAADIDLQRNCSVLQLDLRADERDTHLREIKAIPNSNHRNKFK